MKQPTISFHMKKMEAEWGVKLFQAKAGKIFLSKAGKILLPYATQITSLYSEAESKIAELRDNERTLLRVGCTDCAITAMARSNWLTTLIDKKDIQVTIQSGNEEALYDLLQSGMLDLVICGQRPRDSHSFHYEKMASSALKLVVPSGHPLLQVDELTSHNLNKYAFVEHSEASITELLTLWKAHLHWNLKVSAKFESAEMIINAVHAQLGLAILPKCILPDPDDRVVSLELPGLLFEWSLYASWKPNYRNTPLLEQLIQFDA